MKNLFSLLAFVLLLGSCASEPATNNVAPSIETLEAAYKATANDANAKALLSAYETAAEATPSAELLYKVADLQFQLNRYLPASQAAKRLLKQYPDSPMAAKSADMLAKIYGEKMAYSNASKVVTAARSGAKGETDSPAAIITTMQADIFDNVEKKMNFKKASEYVEAVEVMAMLDAKNPEMPNILSKAAEIAGSNRQFKKALELYEWVYEKYPNSEKAGTALFMQAFTLDNELNQKGKAKGIYQTFINKYPKNGFADSAKFLLENIGKSDEEIISKFQE